MSTLFTKSMRTILDDMESPMLQRVMVAPALAVFLCCAAPLHAQRPSFTGTWVLSRAQPHDSALAGEQLAKVKRTITISQNDRVITIGSKGFSETYRLDGAETTHYVLAGSDSVPETGRARWEGSRLVLVKSSERRGVRSEGTQWLTLTPAGQLDMSMTASWPGHRVRGRWLFDRAPQAGTH